MLAFYKGGAGISSAGTAEIVYRTQRTKQAWQASAIFAAVGALTASARLNEAISSAFSGVGAWQAVPNVLKLVSAAFNGTGAWAGAILNFRTLTPDADASDGTWTDQLGGTNLFAAIDETVINDADYIQSIGDPVNDICKISLSNPGAVDQPFIVSYRYKKQGGSQIDLTVRLLEGTTEIAAWTHTDLGTSFLTADQTLSAGQFAAITDFNNLFIEFNANAP